MSPDLTGREHIRFAGLDHRRRRGGPVPARAELGWRIGDWVVSQQPDDESRPSPFGLRTASSRPEYIIRTAIAPDASAVRAIDNACFPPGDPDRQPAPPDELEAAVQLGDIRILEVAGAVVAYLHTDRTRPDRIYISGIGVAPDCQRLGFGTRLMDDCLAGLPHGLRTRLPIVTITSPRNLVMLGLIFGRGFRARWFLKDYFGPNRDRLGCQLSATGYLAPPGEVRLVPAEALAAVYQSLKAHRHVIQGLIRTPAGAVFELARHPPRVFPPSEAP